MLLADALQVPGEVRLHYGRQHRHAVLVALAAPHDDLVRPEIHVLDAELAALQEPEPGPIEKKRHESRRAFEPPQHGPHLFPGQDDVLAAPLLFVSPDHSRASWVEQGQSPTRRESAGWMHSDTVEAPSDDTARWEWGPQPSPRNWRTSSELPKPST